VNLELEIELGTVLVILAIAGLGVFAHYRHERTRRALEDIKGEAKGVRIRLERHDEETKDERRKFHEEAKRGRSQLYQMFVEFLNYMKGR
jgi:hypothetical protein